MNQYYSGTSAYKLDEYERYAKRHSEQSSKRKVEHKRQNMALCRFMALGVVALFLVASSLVYLNVMTLRAATETERLKDDLVLITEQNNHKEMEIRQNLDLKLIEERAINELGMQKPDNNQIVYVGVKQTSYSEIGDEGSAGKSVAEVVKNTVGGFVEYFTR